MKAQDLKKLILSLSQDVVFSFNGQNACINPWNINKYEMGFGDNVMTAKSIDEVMSTPFFDGKPLNEIADKIELENTDL